MANVKKTIPLADTDGKKYDKPQDAKGTIIKLFKRYLKKYWLTLIIVFTCAIASTIFTIVSPKILGKATTEIFNGIMRKIFGNGEMDFNKIWEFIKILVTLYFFSMVFGLIQGLVMTQVAQKVTYKMRDDLSKKIHRLPMNTFDRKNKGEVLSLLTNDIDIFGQYFNQSITTIITSVCTIVGILIMMFTINVTMTFISILILPISTLLLGTIVKKSQKYFKNQQEYLGHVNSEVEEIYGGHNIVKAFNKEEDVEKDFDKMNQELYKVGWKSQFVGGCTHPIMSFISNIGYVACAIVGGYFAMQGRIEIGDIQSFITYNKQYTSPLGQIAQILAQLQTMIAAAERVLDFLAEEEEKDDEKNPVPIQTLLGNIMFDHVKFGYNPDKVIIKDFNCDVRAGQKIAIVGPTGARKNYISQIANEIL